MTSRLGIIGETSALESDVRILVYKDRISGLWQVHESWKSRPSVDSTTWEQAMLVANRYAHLLHRMARRKGLA